MIPPLAIIQARLHSQRLDRKMLLALHGKPLIQWAWEAAMRAWGGEVVIACPDADVRQFELALPVDARIFGWAGPEEDVLGRFHACAHQFRTEPDSPLWRITPDDVPIQPTREGFTLAELDAAHETTADPYLREHIGYALFPNRSVEVNTAEDFAYLKRRIAAGTIWDRYPSWPRESNVK